MATDDLEKAFLESATGEHASLPDLRKAYYQGVLDGTISLGGGISQEAAEDIAQAAVDSDKTGAGTFASLRLRTPRSEGERVFLQGHTTAPYGAGWFRGHLTAKTDDGGTIASNGGSYYWERERKDDNDLTVCDFGAIPGGTIACDAAFLLMDAYSYANNPKLGIKFPAGRFLINGVDLSGVYRSFFRVVGTGSPYYGYFGTTTLVSDKGTGFIIKCKARRTEISNLIVDGQNNTTANTKGFFQNIQTEGQYNRITNMSWSYIGGVVVDLIDTLDTKIDQFYATACNGGVFNILYSSLNSWDHSTALEFSNFNVQACNVTKVFNVPRATQSMMYNGWIEKCDYPGDLSNGQWVMNAMSCEGNQTQFNCAYSRVIFLQPNVNNSSSVPGAKSGWSFADDATITRWLSSYEDGRIELNNYGIRTYGSLDYDFLSTRLRVNNLTDATAWYALANINVTAISDVTVFNIMGANPDSNSSDSNLSISDNNFAGGQAKIRLRKPAGSNLLDTSISVEGRSPVLDVKIERASTNNATVYVQLRAQSGWLNCNIETTTNSRYHAGIRFLLKWRGELVSDTDMAALTTVSARRVSSWGTIGSGMAFGEDKVLRLTTADLVDGKMKIKVNGLNYMIPLEIAPIGSDTFNRTGTLATTTPDNLLGGSLSTVWTAGGTGATANFTTASNQLTVTNNALSSVLLDVGTTNAKVSFTLVSGPATAAVGLDAALEFRGASTSTSADSYLLQMFTKTSGVTKLRLSKRVASTVTNLSPSDLSCNDGDVLKVVFSGTTISLSVNGTVVQTITDSSITAGNYVGFRAGANNTGYVVSNFKVEYI